MPTVMVVDDTAVDRRLAGGLLERATNLNVCYAHDGDEALTLVGQEMPDLVLTDLQMPNVDGLQLVNVLRERYPGIPVVLIRSWRDRPYGLHPALHRSGHLGGSDSGR